METLILEKKDEVYLTVDAEPSIQRELSEFFTFYVPGYKFMPAFRNRMWDGKIRMFSQKTKEIYFGLFPYIKAFAEERGYNVVCGEDVEIENKIDFFCLLGEHSYLAVPHTITKGWHELISRHIECKELR